VCNRVLCAGDLLNDRFLVASRSVDHLLINEK